MTRVYYEDPGVQELYCYCRKPTEGVLIGCDDPNVAGAH